MRETETDREKDGDRQTDRETYGAHERVEDTDSKRCATRKRLRHVQLCAGVVIVILVQKLDISIITWTAAQTSGAHTFSTQHNFQYFPAIDVGRCRNMNRNCFIHAQALNYRDRFGFTLSATVQ